MKAYLIITLLFLVAATFSVADELPDRPPSFRWPLQFDGGRRDLGRRYQKHSGSDHHEDAPCQRRCNFGEFCCGGRCVKLMTDANNCGGCGHKCVDGAKCAYGMCNYA